METDSSVVSYELEFVRTSKKDEDLRSLLFTEKIKMNGSRSLVHTRSIEMKHNFHPFPVRFYYSVIKKWSMHW